jgi:L-lysine 6-oxidase
VARLGNSPTSFYLEPITIGGMPVECDSNGNQRMENGKPVFVKHCKEGGRVRRQAAQLGIYVQDSADPSDPGREIRLDDSSVESIEWTVHLANKKAAWYDNDELIGNVMMATATDGSSISATPHQAIRSASYDSFFDAGWRHVG